jgi:hypothetical protein
MQQLPESRCPMRQKVKALAKFQMQRLVSRRAARQIKERFHTLYNNPAHQHFEPSDFESRVATESPATLGLPGYRTQAGHTGLDPIESVSEVAFLHGKFIRRLITGELYTHNPLYLAVMTIAGLCFIAPFAFCLLASMMSGWNMQNIGLTFALAPLAIIGWKLWIAVNVSVRGEQMAAMAG